MDEVTDLTETLFEPIAEEDVPAWFDDPTLTVRTVDVRASIRYHRESEEITARLSRRLEQGQASKDLFQ